MADKRLFFRIGTRFYSIPVIHVVEVLKPETFAWIPNVSKHILGLMNIRGHVLPVVDYGILLGFSACQISDNTKVMILETRINGDLEQAGFVADEVLGIHTINPESFQSREKLVGREVHESITSISYWNEHSVMHMDIDLLFHSSKLSTE